MADTSAAAHPATDNPVEYIQHHLTNLCLGCDPETHRGVGPHRLLGLLSRHVPGEPLPRRAHHARRVADRPEHRPRQPHRPSERARDAGRVRERDGARHLPEAERPRRSPRAHHLPVGVPDEPDGPRPGRSGSEAPLRGRRPVLQDSPHHQSRRDVRALAHHFPAHHHPQRARARRVGLRQDVPQPPVRDLALSGQHRDDPHRGDREAAEPRASPLRQSLRGASSSSSSSRCSRSGPSSFPGARGPSSTSW